LQTAGLPLPFIVREITLSTLEVWQKNIEPLEFSKMTKPSLNITNHTSVSPCS